MKLKRKFPPTRQTAGLPYPIGCRSLIFASFAAWDRPWKRAAELNARKRQGAGRPHGLSDLRGHRAAFMAMREVLAGCASPNRRRFPSAFQESIAGGATGAEGPRGGASSGYRAKNTLGDLSRPLTDAGALRIGSARIDFQNLITESNRGTVR